MADREISKTGLWVDADTGLVVDTPPRHGPQIVPPGGEMRPDRVAALERARANEPTSKAVTVTDPEPDPDASPAPAKKAPAKKAPAKKR